MRGQGQTRTKRRAWLVVVALLGASCGGEDGPNSADSPAQHSAEAPTPNQAVSRPESVVAEATGKSVEVVASPEDGSKVTHRLANPQPSGAPLVFLVVKEEPAWLKVLLPVRPNGSTGWIRRSVVSTYTHRFHIVVELGAHRITVYEGKEVSLQEPIAVGTRDRPTPGGLYYIKELLQPPNPNTVYGPYAYGLSGFSNVLETFAGGEAVIGIHGNNDPSSIGKDVSSGCIRMSNPGITKLAKTLPLGVPVEIRT